MQKVSYDKTEALAFYFSECKKIEENEEANMTFSAESVEIENDVSRA